MPFVALAKRPIVKQEHGKWLGSGKRTANHLSGEVKTVPDSN